MIKRISIQSLRLSNYRNLKNFEIDTKGESLIILGENATGKTNILESLSLLSSSRGMRSSSSDEILNNEQSASYWSINTAIYSKIGLADISIRFDQRDAKKDIKFNGTKIKSTELMNFIDVLWLAPHMSSIFLNSNLERRKFFDRITYSFKPNHAKLINKYDAYLQERRKFLQDYQNKNNSSSLDSLEYELAKLNLLIIQNRTEVLNKLQEIIDNLDSALPKCMLVLEGIEKDISSSSVLQDKTSNSAIIIDFIVSNLKKNRKLDFISSKNNFGIHRSNLCVLHKLKNAKAQQCSTGEQKAMLATIIIAQVKAITNTIKTTPVLLLDEIFVHLDILKQQDLIKILLETNAQLWITATELESCSSITKHANTVILKH